MNTTSEQKHSSLAQRIAKVRNCMLVELSTGVSATDKDLFVSLCQAYDQNSVEKSCTVSASSRNTLDQVFSLSHLTPESILPYGPAAVSRKGYPFQGAQNWFLGYQVVQFGGFR